MMKKFIGILEKIQLTIGVLFLTTFFVVIVIQIVTRHLGISVIWTEEAANYSFIWAVFMGASVMVNRRDHFTFDYMQRKLKGKSKVMLLMFIDIVLILFNIGIFYFGLQVVDQFWNYNWAALPSLKMGYVWISIPVMAGTMLIYSISHFIEGIQLLRQEEVKE